MGGGGDVGGVEVDRSRWRWTSPRKTLPNGLPTVILAAMVSSFEDKELGPDQIVVVEFKIKLRG